MWVFGQYDVPCGGCCKSNLAFQKISFNEEDHEFSENGFHGETLSKTKRFHVGGSFLTEDPLHKNGSAGFIAW